MKINLGKHFQFRNDVWSAQGRNTIIYIQIYKCAFFLGDWNRNEPMFRLELFKPEYKYDEDFYK